MTALTDIRSPCTPALPTRQISGRRQQFLCAQPNRLQSLLGPLLNVLAAVWRSFSHATKPMSAFSMTQEQSGEEEEEEEEVVVVDKLETYLALPQIK